MLKMVLILLMLASLSVVDCCEASTNNTFDIQRVTVYTAYPDNSIECHTTFMFVNPHEYTVTNNSFFVAKPFLFVHGTVSNLSVWDSNYGLHLIGIKYKTKEEAFEKMKNLDFRIAAMCNLTELNIGYFMETVVAHVDKADFYCGEVLFLKMHYQSSNYIKALGTGMVQLKGETHPEFENYSLITIIEVRMDKENPNLNVTKDELYVNLPYDTYHYTDSISAFPTYDDIQYNGEGVILKWDLSKMEPTANNGIIRIIYQVHENEIKKDIDSATLNSLELAEKADTISKISLFISLISLVIAFKSINLKGSSSTFIKWIIVKSSKFVSKYKK